MSTAPVTEKLFIDGPVGRLEALLDSPRDGLAKGSAVVCHPHPQHGGTMHNKVAHTLARAFVRQGLRTLRFNFRGTEASEGRAAAVEVAGLISVAPAIYRFARGMTGQPRCPWLIVQGDEDELVAVDETVEWVNGLEPGPELLVMAGAEHFFHGRLVELRNAVEDFVAESRA
jgi:alpha/beta superfamily hydrolase